MIMPKKIILLLMLCILTLSAVGYADTIVPDFVDYQNARADITWHYRAFGQETTIRGVFSFTLPDKYSLSYFDDDYELQRFNGYRDLVAHYPGSGQVRYQYELIQPFHIFARLFVSLLQVNDQGLSLLANEVYGGRAIASYLDEEGRTLCFDQETSIPLRITDAQGNLLLSLRQYRVDAEDEAKVQVFSLMINDDEINGLVQLTKRDEHWFPTSLQLTQANEQVLVEFANWYPNDTDLAFNDLKLLDFTIKQGRQAYTAQKFTQAIKFFQQVQTIDPYYAPAYRYLGNAYYQLGNRLGTVESLQQWLTLEPNNPKALNNLAYIYMEHGIKLEQAIELAYQAVSLDPQATYLDTLGYGYYLVHDYEKSLHYLLQAAQLYPQQVNILEHIVLVYETLGDLGQAESYQQQILSLVTGD